MRSHQRVQVEQVHPLFAVEDMDDLLCKVAVARCPFKSLLAMSDEEPFANVSSKLREGANGFDRFRKALKQFELRDIEISPYTCLRSPGFSFRNKMLEGVEGLKRVDHVSD